MARAQSSYFLPEDLLSQRQLSITTGSLSWMRNQGWLRIYRTPLREPMRWLGFLASRPLMSDFTSLETGGVLGNLGSECSMAWKISSFLGAQKGERPKSSSQSRIPSAQKSTWYECPDLASISGAMYSGEPQQEQVIQSSSMSGLDSPKSVILIFPCASNRIFSSLISRNSMLCVCRYSSPLSICSMSPFACPSVKVRTRCKHAYRLPKGQYSSPNTIQCLVSKAQSRSMRFSCRTLNKILRSFSSIFTFLAVVTVSLRMNLRAQNWWSSLQRPRNTCENPPLPRNLLISKSENQRDSQLMGRRSRQGVMEISLMPFWARRAKVASGVELSSSLSWQLKGMVSQPTIPQTLGLLFSAKSAMVFSKSGRRAARCAERGQCLGVGLSSGRRRLTLSMSSPFSSSVERWSWRWAWSPRTILRRSMLKLFSLGVERQLSMADFSQGVPRAVRLKRQLLLACPSFFPESPCRVFSFEDRRGSRYDLQFVSSANSSGALDSGDVSFRNTLLDFDFELSINRKGQRLNIIPSPQIFPNRPAFRRPPPHTEGGVLGVAVGVGFSE